MVKKTKRSALWIPQKKSSRKSHFATLGVRQKYVGIHLMADFWYGKIIEDPKRIEKILIKAVKKSKNIPLKTIIHKFLPQGITGVVLLVESHIAIHTWPEFNYVAIDIYTCGNKTAPQKALEYLKKEFQPKEVKIKKIKRGKIYVGKRTKKNL